MNTWWFPNFLLKNRGKFNWPIFANKKGLQNYFCSPYWA